MLGPSTVFPAKPASIKPHGTLIASMFPAVWVSVKRGAGSATLVLVPIVAAYEKVSGGRAEALAEELRKRVARAE